MKRSTITITLLCLLALLAQPFRAARAQVASSELNGTVMDSSNAGVPKAKVTIRSKGTGFTRTVFTNDDGQYTIPDLTPGAYDITVEVTGFKKSIVSNTNLYVGRTSTQDFRLEVGAEVQQVTVQATAPLLTTTNGQLGTVIAGEMLNELPLNGRNFMQLGMLSPGTVVDKNGSNAIGATYSPAALVFSVNGHATAYNLYLMDGVMIKDFEDGPTLFQPSVDAIQEFQATTSNYSALYGTEAAGQINLTLKSGTNQFHGTAFEYLRNNALDAANFFQHSSAPPFKRNQAGGNIGGPVRLPHYNGKDQTFFFFNYETFRQIREIPETANYPTAAQLNGDLSALVPDGQLINPFTGTPFPGSVIPQNMIRPAGLLGFLQNGIGKGPWVPIPNVVGQPGFNYEVNSHLNYTDNQYITRIDRKLTDNTNIYGHFTFDNQTRTDPNAHPNWGSFNDITAYSIAGHIAHTFSPNLVFDTAVGLSHFMQSVLVDSTPGKFDITNKTLGINGNCTAPVCWGAPGWNVSGYTGLGQGFRQPRQWYNNVFEVRPTFTFTKGNHLLRGGMDISRINENFIEIINQNGQYSFNGQFTGNALGDFLLDLPLSVSSAPNPFAPDNYFSDLEPYFQDDWKVTSRLSLNLGLRYVWIGNPLSHNNRSIANIYFPPAGGVPEVVIADSAKPITFFGTPGTFFTGVPFVRASSVGLPEALIRNDNTDFSPRLGFAYRLGSNTVLRGGYGLFYELDMVDKYIGNAVNPPFIDSTSVTVDHTNFQLFDPLNPYTSVVSSSVAASLGGSQIKHRMGRAHEWNLTLEQTWHNTLFGLGYVGNISQHLPDSEDPNQAAPGPGSVVSRRRWPTIGSFSIFGENSIGNYNSLQAHVQHNFSHGFALVSSYTWAKAMDETTIYEGGAANMDLLNRTSQYGLAGQDLGQRFTVSYVYELPVGRGKRFLNTGGLSNAVLGGWQLNGVTSANTGSPLTAFQNFNIDNSDAGQNRPDRIGNPNDLSHSRPRGQQVAKFFDTGAFRQADLTNGTYRFGNEGRNTIIGPGTYDWDFAIYKNFAIRERVKGQFRVETFNLFNRPIFAQPGSTLGTPQYGVITSTAIDSREIQFALRLSF